MGKRPVPDEMDSFVELKIQSLQGALIVNGDMVSASRCIVCIVSRLRRVLLGLPSLAVLHVPVGK